MSALSATPLTSCITPGSASRGATSVLIASPDSAFRHRLMAKLPPQEEPFLQAQRGAEVLAVLDREPCSLLLLDRHQPDLDAEELRSLIHKRFPHMEIVLVDSLAGRGDDDDSAATRDADADAEETQIAQPPPMSPAYTPHFPRDADIYTSNRFASSGSDRNPAPGAEALPGMIGASPAMHRVYRMIRLVAGRTTTVLLTGPSGTGKEVVARAVHALSPRANRPFVVVNCAAIPEALLESELFGHARGAFTGAVQSHNGRILAAQGGTLFLDEIGDMPLSLQAKLLRFLEYKEVQRLGCGEAIKVDVRVVAATNVNLPKLCASGQFRVDLFYRLTSFPVDLPSLAEHADDVLLLSDHFLTTFSQAAKLQRPQLSAAAARRLQNHAWPGNVRELQHVIERALILSEGARTLLPEHLYFPNLGLSATGNSMEPGRH